MNRSVCRVMVGVAAMAVLEMTATPAGAQTGEVKEKPRPYRYDSYWTIPRADWGDVDKDNAAGDQKNFAPALADGTIVEYDIDRELIRKTDSPAKFVYLVVTPSAEGLDKLTADVRAAVSEIAVTP